MAQEDHLKDTKTKEELEHTKSTIRSVCYAFQVLSAQDSGYGFLIQHEELGPCKLHNFLTFLYDHKETYPVVF